VFHLAARDELQKSIVDPADCYSVNIDGTAILVKEAIRQKVNRMIFASSCAVYPLYSEKSLSEDMATIGETPYALSKRAGEQTLSMYNRLEGLSACSLRCFNIYGEGQRIDSPYAAVIPKFIAKAIAGEPITVNGSGDQTRDFIHVADVVDAYLLAAEQEASGTFNLGTGTATDIKTLAALIQSIEGRSDIVHLPALPGDAVASQADISLISDKLGFKPIKGLKSSLSELYFSMKQQESYA
jgi:UDP-glucose 4-epimerase